MPTAAVHEPWDVIHYAVGHGRCPVDEFLDGCPTKVSAQLIAVLDNVEERPAIAVVTGLRKPWMTAFSERDYESVRRLGVDHRAQFPRRIKQ